VTARLLPLLVLVLGACGGGAGSEAAGLRCSVAHRESTSQAVEGQQEHRLGPGESADVAFGDLRWTARHDDDPGEGPALLVQVEERGEPLATALFQLGRRVRDQFRGGHGFTGLQYAYGASGAELQWWCRSS
jgi:hypothetical protein